MTILNDITYEVELNTHYCHVHYLINKVLHKYQFKIYAYNLSFSIEIIVRLPIK